MTLKDPTQISRTFSFSPEMANILARQCTNLSPAPTGDSQFERERYSPMVDQDGHAELRLAHTIAMALRMSQDPVPITINNISAAQAEVANQTQLAMMERAAAGPARRPSLEIMADMFNTFFSSNFNRFCFFSVCGVGVYMYWSYLDHKWHMEQVQRRIDSNFLLRTSQWLFNDSQLLNAPKMPQNLPSPNRLFPSLW